MDIYVAWSSHGEDKKILLVCLGIPLSLGLIETP